MKKILLIATGGTIASKSGDLGLIPAIGGGDMLDYVPEVRTFCNVDSVQLYNIDSTNVTPAHWVSIAEKIREVYDLYLQIKESL